MSNLTAPDNYAAPAIWRCAVPTPLRRSFDYWSPKDGDPAPKPGIRVKLPFGSRSVIAFLLAQGTDSDVDPQRLRQVASIIDTEPLFPPPLFELLMWTAAYYQHPLGEVLPLGLSPGERRGKPEHPLDEPGLMLNERGRGLPEGAPASGTATSRAGETTSSRPSQLEATGFRGVQSRLWPMRSSARNWRSVAPLPTHYAGRCETRIYKPILSNRRP